MFPHLPGARDIDILETLREVVREFCEETRAFTEELGPIAVVDWRQRYDLSDHHNYTAHIHQLRSVTLNGIEQGDDEFRLSKDRWLVWDEADIPHDVDDTLLVCGTAGITDISDWQAITDGSFGFTVGSDASQASSLNFSVADTFDDVADIMQAGIRDALNTNVGYVKAICTTVAEDVLSHFLIWVKSDSTVSYLSAGSTGTDISGSGYMNGLTGSGTLSANMIVNVTMRPDFRVESLPYWFLDRYAPGIMAGAIARMAMQEGKRWYNTGKAALKQDEYEQAKTKAVNEDQYFRGHAQPVRGLSG